ncbi:hypothetical protein OQA88_9978 [Cercophora sp. LCS_1]
MKSPFQPFAPAAALTEKRVIPRKVRSTAMYNILRSNFPLLTWLALGSLVQGLVSLFLPSQYALVPVVCYLSQRILRTAFMYFGLIRGEHMAEVLPGRFTAQIPGRDGSPPQQPGDQEITIIILATRSNHPLGVFAPGYAGVYREMGKMIADLHTGKEKYGFLGNTAWQAIAEQSENNQIMTLMYFRSVDDLHNYAHGPLHRKAWEWWNSITKDHPHLSIMHEVYHAPKGHWENIFVNNHLTGIANTVARVDIDGQKMRPLFDASHNDSY